MAANQSENLPHIHEPVDRVDTKSKSTDIEDGMALCLSGGGYRAMVFHAGALWRLNELGLLKKLKRISSVSGGSITAGVLGMNWQKLQFDA
jgi:NTE family protein